MAMNEAVGQALSLGKLHLPAKPKVLSIEATDYVDHMGEPALEVWVTIDEGTPDSELTGQAFNEISMVIDNSLQAHGVTLFPYLRFGKPSERQELAVNA